MSEQIGIDINGIHITEEDLERQAAEFNKNHGISIASLVDTVMKGLHSPRFGAQASVSVASLLNPHCKPWLGAVFSTDPEQMKETDERIKRLVIMCRPEELQVVNQHKAIYDELVKIYRKLQVNDMGCYAASTLVVQWARNCGFELHEPYTVKSFGASLMRGNHAVNKWQDIVNSALNFLVNNHNVMGNDLGRFIDEVCVVSNYLTEHYNTKGRIDQVEPNVFRVMTTGDNPTLLFMWKQHVDGYTIKRNQK